MLKIKTFKKHFWKISLIATFIFFAIPSAVSASTIFRAPSVDGLVGYWNFDIGAGGSAVYDMSGQANNGTMVNMDPATDWVDGKVGSGALDFDGSNDHINIPDSSNWDLFGSNTGGATLSLWVKHNSWNTTDAYIAHRQDDSNAWWIQHEAGGTMWFGIYTTAGFIVQTPAGGAITNTNWHHITLVKNENVYTLSLDGIVAGTVTDDSTAVFTGPLFIGDITSIPAMSPVYPFDGLIDDVRVYNRALSAEEIQRLYKTTAGTKISKPSLSNGLVGYWNFDINAGGSTAYDMSGQANNGTLVNMDPATDWVDGKVGSGALDFDGVNDYVNIINNSLFEDMISNANVNKTLAVWFNADTLAAESVVHLHPSLMNKGNVYMNFGVDDSGELAFMWYNVSAVTQRPLTSGAGISTGSWYHGAVVLNEGTITLYVNGVNRGSDTFTGIHAGATGGLEWFGTTGGTQNTQRWDGKMDDARVYNRALSAEEIQRLYKTTAGTKINKLPFLSKGLVGYWDLNDGAGSTVAEDKSGQGHNGTLTLMDPATDWVDGKVGSGALDFDGGNDYVDMGSQPDLRFNSGNFTISGWVKPDVITGTNTLVANYFGPNTGYILSIYNSKIGYYSNAWKSANTTLSTGTWYHIAITVDSSGNYIFYLNGVSDGSGASTLPAANEDTFKIGAYDLNGGLGRFNGIIDDVRVYNRALSAEEIQRLYDLGNLKP